MYDIYTQKIYPVPKKLLYSRLMDSFFRFINHEVKNWIYQLADKYEERVKKDKGIEKWWLRAAFQNGLLPEEVLMRKKEAFSDGVSASKSWYQMIQDFVEDKVSDEELKWATFVYPYCTPTTKEAYYYRSLFEVIFPGRAEIIPGFWQPKWDANGEVRRYVDPSARTLGSYA